MGPSVPHRNLDLLRMHQHDSERVLVKAMGHSVSTTFGVLFLKGSNWEKPPCGDVSTSSLMHRHCWQLSGLPFPQAETEPAKGCCKDNYVVE